MDLRRDQKRPKVAQGITHTEASPLPSGLAPADRVVFFDGVCKFCSFGARFVYKRDPRGLLKLALLQSENGRQVRAWCGLPADELNTFIFIDRGRAFYKSSAALRVFWLLRWPWPLLSIFLLVPRFIRDFAYDLIARHRYRLFGQTASCMLPDAQMTERFLKDT